MLLFDNRTGVEVVERRGCLELLAGEVLGRIGIVEGGTPLILPVNYALDGEAIVFRTGPGSKLDSAHGGAACFEVDAFDREGRSGWSVVVRGRLEEITAADQPALDRVEKLADPWLGERPSVVRLVPQVITGRRIRPG